jgi:lysozyme
MRRWWGWAPLTVAVGAAAFVLSQPQRWDEWRTSWVMPDPAHFPIRGIDVSHHQGPIDWPQVKSSGQSFAFIKATEGADFRDTRFADNWQLARAQGLVTGAYHFFTFCSAGLAQAENFLAVAPLDAPSLPLAVDVEFTGNCVGWESLDAIRHELRVFVERVRAHAGHSPLLYTTEEVRLELVPAALHGHDYWIRSLWCEPDEDLRWHFWQYSDTGRVAGISGEVDLNVFSGTVAHWQELVARSAPHSRLDMDAEK